MVSPPAAQLFVPQLAQTEKREIPKRIITGFVCVWWREGGTIYHLPVYSPAQMVAFVSVQVEVLQNKQQRKYKAALL